MLFNFIVIVYRLIVNEDYETSRRRNNLRKLNTIPSIKPFVGPGEKVSNTAEALPLYSSPALKDHSHANFISSIPESVEFAAEIIDTLPESVQEVEVAETVVCSSHATTSQELSEVGPALEETTLEKAI